MNVVRLMSSALILVSLSLSGCGERTGPTKSVEFYEKNEVPRSAMLKQCKELDADASKEPNCVNASRAEVSARQSDSVPKVKFPSAAR